MCLLSTGNGYKSFSVPDPHRIRTVTVPDYSTPSLIKLAAAVQKSGCP